VAFGSGVINERRFRSVVGMGAKAARELLMIDADIHNPIMELSPEDRRDREKVNEAVRQYRERSE
jgi:hypothetical protein